MKIPLKNLTSLLFSGLLLLLINSGVSAQTDPVTEGATITEGSKVSLEYTLSLDKEGVIDSNVGGEPLVFVFGSRQIIPGLEKKLDGLKTGDERKMEITPEEGYGPVYQEAITTANLSQLPADLQKVGAMVQTQNQEGQTFRGKVINIEGDKVTVDFNHPLAGKTLYFEIKVLNVE